MKLCEIYFIHFNFKCKWSGFFLYIIHYSSSQKYVTKNFKHYQIYFDVFLFEKIYSMERIYKQSIFKNKILKIRHLKVIQILKAIINKRLKS